MEHLTIGQAITGFIIANLGGVLVHLIILIRTGGKNERRLRDLEEKMDDYTTRTDQLQIDVAVISDRVKYRKGGY